MSKCEMITLEYKCKSIVQSYLRLRIQHFDIQVLNEFFVSVLLKINVMPLCNVNLKCEIQN